MHWLIRKQGTWLQMPQPSACVCFHHIRPSSRQFDGTHPKYHIFAFSSSASYESQMLFLFFHCTLFANRDTQSTDWYYLVYLCIIMSFNWAKFDAWRKHPLLVNNMRQSVPGLGIGLVAFAAYVAYDQTLGEGSKKQEGH